MAEDAMRIALIGNPNCGKTALFNQLTGSKQKVANYAGVTVERKEGRYISRSGQTIRVLDLPGTYSFDSASPDERISLDVLQGNYPGETRPDLIVCVADATNLRLHLRFVLDLRELGRPMVLVLNMADAAERRGIKINAALLSQLLGIPVIQTVAVRKGGIQALIDHLDSSEPSEPQITDQIPGVDTHAQVRYLLNAAVVMPTVDDTTIDSIDRWTLHPFIGPLILLVVMFSVFQGVYSIGKPVTDLIGDSFDQLNTLVAGILPAGPIQGLICDGIISGVGTVLGFLPEIIVLFLFILLLEESGYLPRAAFLLDKLMVSVGLTGRSFIPLLSSFACAIPGIIGTRSITDKWDRWVTILVTPLMTCSARLPVYALLISAFIPDKTVGGMFNLQGILLFALYMCGIVGAMVIGWISKFFGRSQQTEHPLLMELPAYRLPRIRDIALGLWERGAIFMRRLTGVILVLTIIMWFISSFPLAPADATGPAIDYSFAGDLGKAIQGIFAPLGFNWQITLSLIPAFAARETAVATLATVYAVSTGGDDITALAHVLSSHFSVASALSLMVWFAFAPQCMSTLAVIRRETHSWKMVWIAFAYQFVLAYLCAYLTYLAAGAWL